MNYLRLFSMAIVASALAACTDDVITEEKAIRPVNYQTISYQETGNVRTFSGLSKTDKVIQLSFRGKGVVTVLNAELGQQVKKGQLLAKLDNVESRLNYENAISSKNSAESQMRTAKLSLDRTRALFEKGGAALSDYESAKNAYRTAQQSYQSAIRSAGIQKDQIQYGYLYAPATGVISAVNVELNENASAGQIIATLNSGKEMEISLGLPESVINAVQKNMPVKVSFTSIPGEAFNGKVSEVSPALSDSTATYPVTVVLDVPSTSVKSGMTANVKFDFNANLKEEAPKLIVPTQAVGEDGNGKFVYRLNVKGDHAIAEKVNIKIGTLTPNGFEVVSGLKADDKVATAGLQTLLNGQAVKLQ